MKEQLVLQAVRTLPNGNKFIVRLHKFPAHVYAVTENRPAEGNSAFNSRNFRVCGSYPTVTDNMKRARSFYKLDDPKMGWHIENFETEVSKLDGISYKVWQTDRHGIMFRGYDECKDREDFTGAIYNKVYEGTLPLDGFDPNDTDAILEAIFRKLNVAHPADYKARSLSVGDIVELSVEGGVSGTYFVDDYGFEKLPDHFLKD